MREKKINQQINKWQSASLIMALSQKDHYILLSDNVHSQLREEDGVTNRLMEFDKEGLKQELGWKQMYFIKTKVNTN